jgi:nucleotide-binding universal stress UspA family protein
MFKHILIATDGSELAAKAVTTGLELAKALGAKVTFVSVTEPAPISFRCHYHPCSPKTTRH